MSNVGIFYDHLEYFMAIWYNLWPFGIVCGHLLNFFPIWKVWTKKNLATLRWTPPLDNLSHTQAILIVCMRVLCF
jgi:hypothetical protein